MFLSPEQRTAVRELSPLIWPLLFLAAALIFRPPAPLVWLWDTYSYVDAARTRTPHVPLGLGRPLFCLVGMVLDVAAGRAADSLFGLFKIWVLATVTLQTVLFGVLGLALRRVLGLAAAHIWLATFLCHTPLLEVHLAVWPENLALSFGLIAAIILLAEGLSVPWRLGLSLLAAVLMVQTKETCVYHVPGLALLAAMCAMPAPATMKRRVVVFLAYGFACGVISAFLLWIMPLLIPGLAADRAYWRTHHFGSNHAGFHLFWTNIGVTGRVLWETPLMVVAAMTGAIVGSWRAMAGASNSRPGMGLLAGALFLPPLCVIAAGGWSQVLDRYAVALLPALATFAAWPFAQGNTGSQGGRWTATAVLLGTLLFAGADWGLLRERTREATRDLPRQEAMTWLVHERLALAVGNDTWPAYYISRHTRSDGKPAPWEFFWPGWDFTTSHPIPEEWVQKQRAARRKLAFSRSTALNLGVTEAHLAASFGDWHFERHPCGWWIGTLREE